MTLTKTKGQLITKAIPNKGFSGKLKVIKVIKIRGKLKRKCFEIPFWA